MGKSESDIVIYAVLVIVVSVLIYSVVSLFTDLPAAGAAAVDGSKAMPSPGNAFSPVLTGTTGPGDVAIEFAPRGMQGGKFEVQIVANTHSVDLSAFDLLQVTTLEYKGKLIKPASAPLLTGHHVSGTLVFAVGEEPGDAFTITIKGIPLVEERVFSWKR